MFLSSKGAAKQARKVMEDMKRKKAAAKARKQTADGSGSFSVTSSNSSGTTKHQVTPKFKAKTAPTPKLSSSARTVSGNHQVKATTPHESSSNRDSSQCESSVGHSTKTEKQLSHSFKPDRMIDPSKKSAARVTGRMNKSSESQKEQERVAAAQAGLKKIQHAISLQETREEDLENKIQASIEEIRSKMQVKNERGALRCLRKKRRLDSELERVSAVIENLQVMSSSIESAIYNVEVMSVMKLGSDAMKHLGGAETVVKVDTIMMDFHDSLQIEEEIRQLLVTTPNNVEDDDEALLRELAELTGCDLPNVPVKKPDEIKCKEKSISSRKSCTLASAESVCT